MTRNSEFRGVYAIPVTPFNEDLSVDWESLRKCVEFSVEAGAHGIVLPVNASEGPFLTDAERKEVLKVGIEVVNGAVPVVAGVSGSSTAVSVELTKKRGRPWGGFRHGNATKRRCGSNHLGSLLGNSRNRWTSSLDPEQQAARRPRCSNDNNGKAPQRSRARRLREGRKLPPRTDHERAT